MLSTDKIEQYRNQNSAKKNGVPGGIRTRDLRLRRPLLYPAELLALINGAGEGDRTLATSLEGWGSTTELHPHWLNDYI